MEKNRTNHVEYVKYLKVAFNDISHAWNALALAQWDKPDPRVVELARQLAVIKGQLMRIVEDK